MRTKRQNDLYYSPLEDYNNQSYPFIGYALKKHKINRTDWDIFEFLLQKQKRANMKAKAAVQQVPFTVSYQDIADATGFSKSQARYSLQYLNGAELINLEYPKQKNNQITINRDKYFDILADAQKGYKDSKSYLKDHKNEAKRV